MHLMTSIRNDTKDNGFSELFYFHKVELNFRKTSQETQNFINKLNSNILFNVEAGVRSSSHTRILSYFFIIFSQ